jgi:transposase
MVAVVIGVDPYKGSHTAVAISSAEAPLGELRVGASASQAQRLLAWAAAWPDRTWAIEGAGGLGYLLAQQLLAAGEQVMDVPPQARSPGAAAGGRRHEQERPERCPVGGRGGAALAGTARGCR